MKKTILIIDDDPVQRRLLQAAVERMDHEAITLEGGVEALEWLEKHSGRDASAVILDLVMPQVDGLMVLRQINERGIEWPVIIQTAQGSIDAAVAAMRTGAFDFVVKPASPERLRKSLEDALRVDARQKRRTTKPKPELERETHAIVGDSESMKRVASLINKAAASDIPVLIEGESGTGKELVARSIQAASARRNKPFVIVNCGAIPDNLVESILFGHEKGAFTGATDKHVGKFVEADGGTLFLDEIGDLPVEAQVKVLRAIQDGEVEPVGARSSRRVNVRLISATHRDLISAVQSGAFREDLYYRLNVFPVMVPPLRYRKEDISDLIGYFIASFKEQGNRFPARDIAPEAKKLLEKHDWPGNIRQLQNAIFRAVVLCEGTTLNVEHFPQITAQVHGIDLTHIAPAMPDMVDIGFRNELQAEEIRQDDPEERDLTVDGDYVRMIDVHGHARSLSEIEADIIASTIAHYNGRMSEVARRLGIGRSTLYRKLKDYNIEAVDA